MVNALLAHTLLKVITTKSNTIATPSNTIGYQSMNLHVITGKENTFPNSLRSEHLIMFLSIFVHSVVGTLYFQDGQYYFLVIV